MDFRGFIGDSSVGPRARRFAFAVFAVAAWSLSSVPVRSEPPPAGAPPVKHLRITVLSTMLAGDPLEKGIGEWGFAALVEADGRRLLFDTGQRPQTVLHNARELGLELGDITDVVFSHHHADHVGGLRALRRAFAEKNPAAFARVHVARGAFVSRGPGSYDGDDNPLLALRPVLEREGVAFHEHAGPAELLPGVWFTGPIPRPHADEQPPPPGWVRRAPDGSLVPDETPDDAALVFDTPKGLVVLTGCGHAGFINTLEYARVVTRRADATIYAATGGFHLARADDAALAWTFAQLRTLGLQHFHGAHCTGLEAVYRLRADLGLPRENASVAAVGSWFDLADGIHPLVLAR